MLQWFHNLDDLEPMGSTALYGDGAGNTGDDSSEEFQNLGDFRPVYFNHFEHGLYGLNGLVDEHNMRSERRARP